MCGIAAVWGNDDESPVRQMMKLLVHRGPDDAGTFVSSDAPGVLGHRRLSIMDPAGGRQPIEVSRLNRAIVANGEIYNFPALRRRLAPRHTFRTRSDTESMLHLYDEVGSRTAGMLDGMFAFAIADRDQLYAARDPIGIKPLYYGRIGDSLAFASELKALAGRASDVQEFPPGTWYHSSVGFRPFYDVPEREPVERPLDEMIRRVRETLEAAVVKRLMSDVPVGAFLSGGLDSSLIAAFLREHVDELHTFSVGVEGSRDLEAARVVANHLQTIHHEYQITIDEVLASLPEIIYHLESYDQDLVRSAIPCHFTSRLASEHVKVILTGEGADELFAGYTYYKDFRDPGALHRELRRSICSLHNVNLQRVDRLTMAHSIEGRVPFLDLDLIALAQEIPPRWKLYQPDGGPPIEKWILRKACEDLLPREIIWRDKEQFDEGSGTVDILADGVSRWMTPSECEQYRLLHPEADLRSLEESVYHRLLVDRYQQPDAVLDNVARWAQRPAAV